MEGIVLGRTRWVWNPKGWNALLAYGAFSLFTIDFLVQFGLDFAIQRWWPTRPDSLHSSPIRFKGGSIHFVQPWLGKYEDYGFWGGFILLAFIFLLMWINRDDVERCD